MEIGVFHGVTAEQIIKAAMSNFRADEIEYYGFDLFSMSPDYEGHFGVPSTSEEVVKKLRKTGAKIRLFKGNTREILSRVVGNLPKMDFIFIDGGHSYKTMKSDWENSKRLMHSRTIVILDNVNHPGVRKVLGEINKLDFVIEILSGYYASNAKVQKQEVRETVC